MSIFERLFSKRRREGKDLDSIKDLKIDRETGEITGEIPIMINGNEFTFPIKTSVNQMNLYEQHKADPNSCEREPNADEVKLPIDLDISIIACDETATMISLETKASLKGYNNFVVPRDLYDRTMAEHERRIALYETQNHTASLNNKGIAAEKEGRIEDAIAAYEENITIGGKALHAYNRLRIIYKRLGRKDDERRVIQRMVEVFGNSEAYQTALQKIDGTYTKPEDKFPLKAEPYKIEGNTMGEKFEEIKARMVEFDFYNSGDESRASKAFQNPVVKEVWAMQKAFSEKLDEAKTAELHYDYETAAKKYEELVANQYQGTQAYDRLIKIYSRAKLKDDEKRVLKHSISFFTELRKNQEDYVMKLARKYGKEDFAIERFRKRQKITYYSGLYELYNPYPIIEKWKQRFEKLENEKVGKK